MQNLPAAGLRARPRLLPHASLQDAHQVRAQLRRGAGLREHHPRLPNRELRVLRVLLPGIGEARSESTCLVLVPR